MVHDRPHPTPPKFPGAPTAAAEEFWTTVPSRSLPVPDVLHGRFPILDVSPSVESGRRPAKAAVGEPVPIEATIFREGHDFLGADVVFVDPDGNEQAPLPMSVKDAGVDRWGTIFRTSKPGDWTFTVRAWADPYATWRHRAEIKVPANLDTDLELAEGALVLERAAAGIPTTADRNAVMAAVTALRDSSRPATERLAAATSDAVEQAMAVHPLRDVLTTCGPWTVRVDRRRALVGAWYELFPRSEGANTTASPAVSGTFATAAERLTEVAAMGFDVVYVPPIHPIGHINRKGKNNSVDALADDVGSPWAIGSEEGGHRSVHPDLGTLDDFADFVERATALELEIAIDLALQVAPDHPWATAGKPWFLVRADGSIAYAENPPKKYQDIYPIWFDGDPAGFIDEVVDIILFWRKRGIRIFRVDNPHTKPLRFWDEVIGRVHDADPEILFLAEAFTRPPMMRALGEVGFHQSYTYFTWRNTKLELEEYLAELSDESSAYMRPNLFVNTPDILTAYLQYGGPAAFAIRATLAATLSPTWGMYAGFELFEHVAVKPGSEEYLNSEKYELRPRDWTAASTGGHTLIPYVTMLNSIRRRHPALQTLRGLTFHPTDSDDVIAYSRTDGPDTVVVVCNLDPYGAHEATVHLNMSALGLAPDAEFDVVDEVSGAAWRWNAHSYVRLDPYVACAHIVTLRKGTV